jgi:hypothetical protein
MRYLSIELPPGKLWLKRPALRETKGGAGDGSTLAASPVRIELG